MTTNSHWTEAQLDALYKRASIPTMEHFLERQAIMEADGGLDPLAAANAAHLSTIEWLKDQISSLDREECKYEAAVEIIESRMRERGLDPDVLYCLPKKQP